MQQLVTFPPDNSERAEGIAAWLIQQGLEGAAQEDVLQGYCDRLHALGTPLMRVHVAQSAFHPRFGSVGFNWWRDTDVKTERYEHSEAPPDQWLQSPLYHLLQSRETELRVDLTREDTTFPILKELRKQGATDYVARALLLERLDGGRRPESYASPEGLLISWTSDGADGFDESDLKLIRSLLPYLGLALKSASNRKMARELLGVYLGRDAGDRVLSGEIQRGSIENIDAAILYFDLIGFTSLSERTDGKQVIELLNDYFGVAVAAIEGVGGHVLKFMGDGLLAMFDLGDAREDADAAMQAVDTICQTMPELNATRTASGLPVTEFTLALHAGEILYGNIGADNRLDFTVIGPAVNLAARISDMHRTLERNIIISQSVRNALSVERHDLVSMGRYMLRGATEPQELFTLCTN